MAFLKRTWLARIGTGLNKFIIGEKDAQNKQTLVNDPDSITQVGDTISADNLNDLEDRIEQGFNDANTALVNGLAGKQNTLTFDNTPTSGSNNPVTSNGVYASVVDKADRADFVVEMKYRNAGWVSVGDRGTFSVTINIAKSGYKPLGVMGFTFLIEDDNGNYPKYSISKMWLTSTELQVQFIAHESITFDSIRTEVDAQILYMKLS